MEEDYTREEWRDNLTPEELLELDKMKYTMLDGIDEEGSADYYDPHEPNEKYYVKSSEDEQKWIEIDEKSLLHPDNPYHQKIIPRWDWIEIEGSIIKDKYNDLICYLKTFNNLVVQDPSEYNTYIKPYKEHNNKYSSFRVKINKKNKVTLNIASSYLRNEDYIKLFKKIRSYLQPNDILIKRLDLSFLLLLDVSNVHIKMKWAKKKQIFMSDNLETETIILGSYKSPVRTNLYNKKVQLEEKKKRYSPNIDYLYNLEVTLKNQALKEWDSIIKNRLTIEKNILSFYNPTQPNDFALMYLYLNEPALFKSKYEAKDKERMERHLRETRKKIKSDQIEFNLKPFIVEAFNYSKNGLAERVYDLTGVRI